jgi:hypothetical protein
VAVGRSFLERKEDRPLRLQAGYNPGELVLG